MTDRTKRTIAQSIISAALAAGLVLGTPVAALADSYVPPPTVETVLPGPTYTAPPAAPVQQTVDHLAQTGADVVGLLWVGVTVIVLGVGAVVFNNYKRKRGLDDAE